MLSKLYMFKRLIFILSILFGIGHTYAQQRDYTKIRFKSKLRNYTKKLPNPSKYDVDKEYLAEIVKLLTIDLYSEKEQKELTIKLWLALSDPKKFDFVYKDYSINTIKNWGKKINLKILILNRIRT